MKRVPVGCRGGGGEFPLWTTDSLSWQETDARDPEDWAQYRWSGLSQAEVMVTVFANQEAEWGREVKLLGPEASSTWLWFFCGETSSGF